MDIDPLTLKFLGNKMPFSKILANKGTYDTLFCTMFVPSRSICLMCRLNFGRLLAHIQLRKYFLV